MTKKSGYSTNCPPTFEMIVQGRDFIALFADGLEANE